MAHDAFNYPSEWTESFEAYTAHRQEICHKIIQYMENYDKFLPILRKQTHALSEDFFSADILYERLKNESIHP
jgi:hypothetical protein